GGLLLCDPQGVLELRSEPGVGGAADLVELRLQVFREGLEALDLLERVAAIAVGLDQIAAQAGQGLVDLVLLVAAKLDRESRVVCRHVRSSLGKTGVLTRRNRRRTLPSLIGGPPRRLRRGHIPVSGLPGASR